MPPLMKSFVQDVHTTSAEWTKVEAIAKALFAHMGESSVWAAIEAANAPGRSSAGIQAVLLPFLRSRGFVDESKGLFAEYATPALRPDYFLRLGDTGILLEVERGKTTINNMDLLDFWKCHLCTHAHYLFLLVPQTLRQNEAADRITRPYNAVVSRLESFFRPRNYTNVRGLVVFGY